MLFLGFELELSVDKIFEVSPEGVAACSGLDFNGQRWVVLDAGTTLDSDAQRHGPDDQSWLCVPITARMLEAIVEGRAPVDDFAHHSSTGWVELVRIVGGKCTPETCLMCSQLPPAWHHRGGAGPDPDRDQASLAGSP